jgi:hypothetical protein
MKRIILATLTIWFAVNTANAQRTIFEKEVSKEIFKNFEIFVSPQVKFRENFDLKEYYFDTGVEYKFSKYFSAATSYRLGTNITQNDNKENFGRFAFDAKAKIKLNAFEPKFRLRYTNGNEDFDDDEVTNFQYLRYKFELEYHLNDINLSPYIYTELFQSLKSKDLNGTRFEGGLMYKINKHHKIGAYYRVNVPFSNSCPVHSIGISYKLKL